MIEFFLKRRVVTTLITLFLVVWGGYHFFTVRREAFPEVSFDWVSVTTLYPGASPEETERLVTNPIEKHVRGLDGVDRVQSFSLEGRSSLFMRLDEDLSDVQKNRVINTIEQAVNRATDLPEETEEPKVEELTWDQKFITVSVAGGDENTRDDVAEELTDAIEDIPGVSRVETQGDRAREIWVEADRAKLDRYRITLAEITQAVRAHNRDMSAGLVDVGAEERLIRVMGAAKTADDIGQFIVRGNEARSYLRIQDVATVTERFEDSRTLTRANGERCIHLNVRKIKRGDTIELSDAVRALVAEQQERAHQKGITLVLSDDVSFFVKRRLHVMKNNMLQGGVLILFALFIFLDWRLAAVAAIGVPISFAAAFVVAIPLGFTINLMSLLAFIIVLGMLDDDSVVVAENIYRHLEMGKPPMKAAVEGAREIALPVIGAVAVSCCGFLPFALVSGVMGKILIMIPIIIIVCFVASVFEAFFILPAHVVDLMPYGKPVGEKPTSGWFLSVANGYRRGMKWMLRHRVLFFLMLFAVLIVTAVLAKTRLKVILFPDGLVDQFFVNVEMPAGTSLAESERAIARIEQRILKLPPSEMEAVTSMVGFKMENESVRFGSQYAQARVFLTAEEKRDRKTKDIIADLRSQTNSLIPGAKLTYEPLQAGPPVGKAVDVRVRGRDPRIIHEIVQKIKAHLAQTAGVSDIRDSSEGGKDEWRITLDDREAGFAGLDVTRVAQTLFLAVDGGEASKIRRSTEEVKIRVRLQPSQRTNLTDLMKLEVVNEKGNSVRIGAVANVTREPGPPFIEHYNFRPALQLTAEVDTDVITSREATQSVLAYFQGLKHSYPGYEVVYGGEAEETEKSMTSLFQAFLVALGLDYIILAALFSSYLQPLLVIFLTVPIGLLGVVYALLLHGQPASFMALLGVVSMTGVVINNAIVLVNFINAKRDEGLPLQDAVVEAGAQRLRPIWASSITTLLGLFPTAYGFGGFEPFVAPMALALAWGLTIAMPMTLFLIPMAYVVLSDVSTSLSNRARRFFPFKRKPSNEKPEHELKM